MKNSLKLIGSILNILILFCVFPQAKALSEKKASPQLIQMLKLAKYGEECLSDDRKIRVPYINGHYIPDCIVFYAMVDVDDNSSLRTWEFLNGKWVVNGKIGENQVVYVIRANGKFGQQPTVLVGIPKKDGEEAEIFATVELRYLRYLR